MSGQVFSPIHNLLAKASILIGVIVVGGTIGMLDLIHRSPYVRYTQLTREQPIVFSHKHHANLGIDCRYCHNTVEESSFANIPPMQTCRNCHNLMWNEAPMLEDVRKGWDTPEGEGVPVEWTRVHDLPDFVYFDHSIHVNHGVGCEECHGRVDQMPLMHKEHPLFMKWCLDCHRDPGPKLRPKELITKMGYNWRDDFLHNHELLAEYGIHAEKDEHGHELPITKEQISEGLVKHYNVDYKNTRLTNCWICHR